MTQPHSACRDRAAFTTDTVQMFFNSQPLQLNNCIKPNHDFDLISISHSALINTIEEYGVFPPLIVFVSTEYPLIRSVKLLVTN